VAIGQPPGRVSRRRAGPGAARVLLARVALALCAVTIVVVAVVVVLPRLLPGERPRFQLPVPCGETWQLNTYPGHGEYDIDMYPAAGEVWGRPVLASYAGTVTEAGIDGSLGGRTPDNPSGPRGRGGGYWVEIDHGGKWTTSYLHLLEPPRVRAGQKVAQGEQIGRVGSTGNSGAPHLHYEQHRGSQKVEAHFDGVPSGITDDDAEHSVTLTSNNCR
jgi:hypothetical protein